jgi:hypothetical protein
VTVTKMAAPGKIASHHAKVFVRASARIEPQVTRCAGTPMPRNERPDSARIADATPNDIATRTGASAFGRMCRAITRRSDPPRLRAASTKSCARTLKNSLRT